MHNERLMPTPKPGQIRCPTCHRPTPMAAFCTQCGAAIPSNAQARPRGMDRQELDARIRQRRPGDGRLRRGTPMDSGDARPTGYVPFEPDPEDARALREGTQPEPRVDNTPADFQDRTSEEPAAEPELTYVPPAPDDWEPQPTSADAADVDMDEEYAEPDEEYPYAWEAEDRRRGGGFLPIIGFLVLAVLALGVGAALAGIFGGGVAETSSTPTPSSAATVSTASSGASPSEGEPQATPEPTDGPVAFPDGATITVQPCATEAMSFDGCGVDGSSITRRTMWVWIGFKDAAGSDTFTLELRSDDQTLDQQDKELGAVLDCPGTCSGYLIGAVYRDLDPGDYQLVVRRNDDFADSATFTVGN
jgi:hypothetical protein